MNGARSGCPINLTLEALGEGWSQIVIRHLRFGNRRQFRKLRTRLEQRRASNIPADRLMRLEKAGLVCCRDNASHKRKIIGSLTEASIALVPLPTHMGRWCPRPSTCTRVERALRARENP